MCELPDLAVVIVEDFVLTVVLSHVAFYHVVVDDIWPHCLFISLDSLLFLKRSLNFGFHRRSVSSCTDHNLCSNFILSINMPE